jgi:hypothetical protein
MFGLSEDRKGSREAGGMVTAPHARVIIPTLMIVS